MNPFALKLAGCACAVLALGLIVFLLKGREWREGRKSDGKSTPVIKRFPRNHDRTDGRAVRTNNPREEFEAARKRGLTEEEVRWIVEDFVAMGIDGADTDELLPQELFDKRKSEHSWYLAALTEGFGLTRKQKEEAEGKLQQALDGDFSAMLKDRENAKGEVAEPKEFQITDLFIPTPVELMSSSLLWLMGDDLFPWSLCELDERQRELVQERDEEGDMDLRNEWFATKDFGTEERYDQLDDPFEATPINLPYSGMIFPLSMKQVDGIREAMATARAASPDVPLLLPQVKFLTAPQLKTLLLFDPEGVAEKLIEELGAP